MLVAVWLFLSGVEVPSLRQALVPQYLVALGILVAEVVALRFDPARWVSFVLGAWLIVAPLALGYPGWIGAFNSFGCGLVVCVLASRANRAATYSEPPTMQREIRQGPARASR